ncbi:MAG: NAD(P)/FAD-dependent oxidoreductase [Thermodesulfobacteriota bacterium]
MIYDYAVIGAGAAGMTSALVLAKHGRSVALIESSGQIGPLLRGFKRKGVFFDTGFHYTGGLGDGEILDIFFRYLGLSNHLQKEPFDPNGFDLFRFPNIDFEFLFPYGYDRIEQRLCDAFPEETSAVSNYLQNIMESCRGRPYLNLNADMGSLQGMKAVHGTTLQEHLDNLSTNSLLNRILSTHCFLHGATPTETSFINHAAIVGPYYQSVNGVQGGGRSIVDAFHTELTGLGVDLFCGHPVIRISPASDGSLKQLHADNDQTIFCRSCICTIHPITMLQLIPPSVFRPGYVNRINGLEETLSAYILYGISRNPISSLANRNIFLYPKSDIPGFHQDMPIAERPVFMSGMKTNGDGRNGYGFIAICPANFRETVRWKDSHTGRRPAEYDEFKTQVAADLKTHAENICPELKGQITFMELSTPLTLRDFSQTPFGSMYGVKHRVGQYNPMPVTRLKGLYLAGQAVVAPGLLGAVISGLLACGNILGHDFLRKEMMQCR